ncbi:T9SS type A sorting domain-containing protein [Mangrovimonas aestuarii]|uniref:T9SS type A sorting domain-containing protein n=1 Tax=Mangrovimonas aestuarii TaxID=3018443 RepID=UPI0023788941|nr:T9SS type A sorting domain-containing protein [Mangrovimonas aestuarii]
MKAFTILKISLLTLFYGSISAQSVDLVANLDAEPPFVNDQYITYTLEAIAGTTEYNGIQVKLNYNSAALQLEGLSNEFDFDVIILNDTAIPGLVRFAAGNLGTSITGTNTVINITFKVINSNNPISISHDLTYPNGSIISNEDGINVLNSSNDILFEPLNSNSDDLSLGELILFPIPASKELYLQGSSSINFINQIKIHDINGKLINAIYNPEIIENKIIVDISMLQESLYFLTATTKFGTKKTFRIVVNH